MGEAFLSCGIMMMMIIMTTMMTMGMTLMIMVPAICTLSLVFSVSTGSTRRMGNNYPSQNYELVES